MQLDLPKELSDQKDNILKMLKENALNEEPSNTGPYVESEPEEEGYVPDYSPDVEPKPQKTLQEILLGMVREEENAPGKQGGEFKRGGIFHWNKAVKVKGAELKQTQMSLYFLIWQIFNHPLNSRRKNFEVTHITVS